MSKISMPHKLNFAQLPTTIQPLERLSKLASKFQDVNLYIKRDDLTHGPATGNKIRKLEYLLAEAKSRNAKVVFTCGGIQSNHARATSILCAQMGLECVLFLRGEMSFNHSFEGNLLLDLLSGSKIRLLTPEQYESIGGIFSEAAQEYTERDGVSPFFIPEGGSSALGGMGYFSAYQEIQDQCSRHSELPEYFDSIVVANGSGGTHAGLLVGALAENNSLRTKVYSFNVCRTAPEMADRVKNVALGLLQRQQMPLSLMADDIQVIDGYVGPGYALADDSIYDFIVDVGKKDGILLDPVYTGKALRGLITELCANPERAHIFGKSILFVHTGGLPSLFAHSENLSKALMRTDR